MSRIVRGNGSPIRVDVPFFLLSDSPSIQRARQGIHHAALHPGPARVAQHPARAAWHEARRSSSSARCPAWSTRGQAPIMIAYGPASSALCPAWSAHGLVSRRARPGMKRAQLGIQRACVCERETSVGNCWANAGCVWERMCLPGGTVGNSDLQLQLMT